MFNFTRLALLLERAEKFAIGMGDEVLVASTLAKAERLFHKTSFNLSQARAIIALYERVITAVEKLELTIPIIEHCREKIGFLRH